MYKLGDLLPGRHLLVAEAILLASCSSAAGAKRATNMDECTVVRSEVCSEENADVIVKAEVAVPREGEGIATRIVSVEPSDHPLREKALEMVQGNYFRTSEKQGTTFVKTFYYCEHPRVTTMQYGSCAR